MTKAPATKAPIQKNYDCYWSSLDCMQRLSKSVINAAYDMRVLRKQNLEKYDPTIFLKQD